MISKRVTRKDQGKEKRYQSQERSGSENMSGLINWKQ
jgi:hypothetical protein